MWNIFGDGPLEWSEDADAVLYARIDGPPCVAAARAVCADGSRSVLPGKRWLHSRGQSRLSGLSGARGLLEYALANDERFGIWGGMSERERRRLRRMAG
mgnify:CR=1 FL=1